MWDSIFVEANELGTRIQVVFTEHVRFSDFFPSLRLESLLQEPSED